MLSLLRTIAKCNARTRVRATVRTLSKVTAKTLSQLCRQSHRPMVHYKRSAQKYQGCLTEEQAEVSAQIVETGNLSWHSRLVWSSNSQGGFLCIRLHGLGKTST